MDSVNMYKHAYKHAKNKSHAMVCLNYRYSNKRVRSCISIVFIVKLVLLNFLLSRLAISNAIASKLIGRLP